MSELVTLTCGRCGCEWTRAPQQQRLPSRCPPCAKIHSREQHTLANQRLRARRREAGVCVECTEALPPPQHFAMCEGCRDHRSGGRRRRGPTPRYTKEEARLRRNAGDRERYWAKRRQA